MSLENTSALHVITTFLTLKEILNLSIISKKLFAYLNNGRSWPLDIFYYLSKETQLRGLERLSKKLANAKFYITIKTDWGEYNHTISEESLQYLPSNTVSLKCISYYLKGEGLKKLPKSLQKLDLEDCVIIENNNFLRFLPPLKSLTLNGGLENNDLKYIPPSLNYLHIYSDIEDFKYSGTSLEVLKINSYNLERITNLPKSLKELDISGCKRFTKETLPILPPNLEIINISGCGRLTKEDFRDYEGITIISEDRSALPPLYTLPN